MSAVFITATGTDIGKTALAAALIRTARRQGIAVDALKPAVSGFDPAAPEGSDPARLLDALGEPVTPEALDRLSPFQYRAPLAPNMAARLEGRDVPFDGMIALGRARIAASQDGLLVIEGAGGVMSPLSDEATNLDLIAALGAPAVLVTGSYLGAISHTLTALTALHARDVLVLGIVVSESEAAAVGLEDLLGELARFAPDTCAVPLPRLPDPALWDAGPLLDRLIA